MENGQEFKITLEKIRCKWCKNDPLYIKYHDIEWGVPIFDDAKIFESLLLEIFQAGLSWSIILNKREGLRKAFSNFAYKKISKYSDRKLEELRLDTRIIRNKLKIKSAKENALAFLKIQKEFGTFSKYIWGFIKYQPIHNTFTSSSNLTSSTPMSEKISADLKVEDLNL